MEASTAATVESPPAGDRPRVTYLVKRLESAVRRDMDAVLREQGLTTPQYAALSILRRHPGLSSAELARRAFVTAQSMQVMVTAFLRHGWVQRESDAVNQRILRNFLTPAGAEILARGQEAADQLEWRMVDGLGGEQVQCLRDALDACVRNLQSGDAVTEE
ncbi:MarR family transcriptional regulator [Arthrobacter crystallopoietes]|uniref:MarR family winged helix-turn-helix transcriptional regulator n=1 Tax=Crystallibacter crystallopoietes TaxID=37928 RepID=UPI003D245508